MGLSLEELGLSKEEVQERVIERIADNVLTEVDNVLTEVDFDEDGTEGRKRSAFRTKLDATIKNRVDSAIARLADEHIIPNAHKYIENICLQETTTWGEKKGEPLTFLQYLVKRAEEYLTEKVDRNGDDKATNKGSYSGFNPVQTRIAYMVHAHLHRRIEEAMKAALAEANKTIVGGLEEAVKIKLGEVAKALQVSVNTGR